MQVLEEVLARRFGGDGAALAEAYRADDESREASYVDLTARIPAENERYCKPLGDGTASTYASLSWPERKPLFQ